MTTEELAHELFEKDREGGYWRPEMTWDDLIDIYKQHYQDRAENPHRKASYEE